MDSFPIHTPEQARAIIAEQFCWPIECVPVPKWQPRREAWEILDASECSILVAMNDRGKIGYRLIGLKFFDGYPTPAQVAAQLTARAEKAEDDAFRAQRFIAAICADIGRGCKGCSEKRCPNYPVEVEP